MNQRYITPAGSGLQPNVIKLRKTRENTAYHLDYQ